MTDISQAATDVAPACIDCSNADAPHLGETRTTPVADGVVRDARVRRCTPCQKKHRSGDCAVCVDLDNQLAAAREEFDYSAESDVRVLRAQHRETGTCKRVAR